jgi:pimeloyl-ACP methyl ester carboxylesterase
LAASTASAQPAVGRSAAGLFYEARGAGEALVFVHGFSLDRRMWEGQMAAFSSSYRVVRYDLRGHGDSAGIEGRYTGYEDLRSVLDALGIGRATLVGLSAGSELAINFAITYPNRVARLVLTAPGLGGYRGARLPWLQPVLDAAAGGDADTAARLWLKTPLMALIDRNAAPTVAAMVMRNARLWTATRTEQPLSPPAIVRLSAITCPVLVVVGDQDQPHIHDIAKVIVKGVTGATLTVIQRAGHLVNLDTPAEFNAAVAAFLARA